MEIKTSYKNKNIQSHNNPGETLNMVCLSRYDMFLAGSISLFGTAFLSTNQVLGLGLWLGLGA